jgi:branched-subunit amino acid aminotransferase/4-amino-4-deoxychorismate lyase
MTPGTPARILAWEGRRLVPQEALADRGVAVADSWLVDDGRVRALAAHQKRFARSCWRETGLPVDEVREFLVAVTAQVPTRGRWFPRVECTATATRLVARLRPAPAARGVVVLTHRFGDPRRKPLVKGPDLAMLVTLREAAVATGADEMLLLTHAGLVIEGALSSVVWWRDDALCVPDRSLATLDSVTRRLIIAMARGRGIQVRRERAELGSLTGLEIWSLSALHGIRPVIGWCHHEAAPRPGLPRRAAAWQADLLALARPIASIAPAEKRIAGQKEHCPS